MYAPMQPWIDKTWRPGEVVNHWQITIAGKTPFFMFRAYGPTEAFYNKTFKMGDVQVVK